MKDTDVTKEWIFELFIRLISQQEVKDNVMTSRVEEEKDKLEETLGLRLNLNLSDIHMIACIGDHEPINVTTLSEKMNLTKGSITRISGKLLEQGLIRREQLNDNKKEVFFRLTLRGEQLHVIHDKLHKEVEQRFKDFLGKYTPEQLDFAKELLQDLLAWEY
ncbi:MarR family transcriptional regulator [Paenibacillus sp. P96]|uniref:MarR family transcriptional regulator n=2 Tax=Paenibacillus zeirhizosphaerae TaxID=2987519 RepID=A0ABT9FSX3_9BACL|nr:MarR family transcriptional regulator [Paenibacillus sp. P96]MDP4097829.1 MarR family transcriptional regulator [Paenibacillus sp. P96]